MFSHDKNVGDTSLSAPQHKTSPRRICFRARGMRGCNEDCFGRIYTAAVSCCRISYEEPISDYLRLLHRRSTTGCQCESRMLPGLLPRRRQLGRASSIVNLPGEPENFLPLRSARRHRVRRPGSHLPAASDRETTQAARQLRLFRCHWRRYSAACVENGLLRVMRRRPSYALMNLRHS